MFGSGFFREQLVIDAQTIQKMSPQLPQLLPFYTNSLNRLKEMASVCPGFLYLMSEERKAKLKNQLQYTSSLIKIQLATGYNASLESQSDICEYLTAQLNSPKRQSFKAYQKDCQDREKKKWDSLSFEKKFAKSVADFPKKSVTLVENAIEDINNFNAKRLYWVWGGCLTLSLATLFEGEGLSFLRRSQSFYSQGAGLVSFYFYFARFSLELYLIFRYVGGLWTETEKALASQLTWQQRLALQLDQRKFILINDLFWSVANCLCALVFIGRDLLSSTLSITFGDVGNYLTFGLLFLDLSVAIWALWEATKNHEEALNQLITDLLDLTNERQMAKEASDDYAVRDLDDAIKDQMQLIESVKLKWKYQKYAIEINLGYSALLVLAFVLLCSLLCPGITVPLFFASTFFLVGSLLAFGLNITAEVLKRYLEGEQFKQELVMLENEVQGLIEQFNKELADPDYDSKAQELDYLYLQIAVLVTEKKNKEASILYIQGRAVVQSLAQALLPTLLLTGFAFLSAGPAAAVVFSVIAALFLVYLAFKYLEPKWAFQQAARPKAFFPRDHKPVSIQDFEMRLFKEETNIFEKAREDFKNFAETFAPKWLVFAFPPVTIALVLAGIVYSLVKNHSEDTMSQEARNDADVELKGFAQSYSMVS